MVRASQCAGGDAPGQVERAEDYRRFEATLAVGIAVDPGLFAVTYEVDDGVYRGVAQLVRVAGQYELGRLHSFLFHLDPPRLMPGGAGG